MTDVSLGGPRRTSLLAGLSLFSGIGAVMCVTTSWFLTHLAGLGDAAGFSVHDQQDLLIASKVVSWVTIGPAVLAVVFWLAARSSITESQGAVGGRGLYRTGVLVAVISAMVALSGVRTITAGIEKAVEGFSWVREQAALAQAQRGWLGITIETIKEREAERLKIGGGVRVASVTAGAPADGALKVGDILYEVSGHSIEDRDDLTDSIGKRRPGDSVLLGVVRDGKKVDVRITLGSQYPQRVPSPVIVPAEPVKPVPVPVPPPQPPKEEE